MDVLEGVCSYISLFDSSSCCEISLSLLGRGDLGSSFYSNDNCLFLNTAAVADAWNPLL